MDAGRAYGWREITPTTAPPPRFDHAMAYDPVREVVVLYGGTACDTSSGCAEETVLEDLWEWDGSQWRQIEVTGLTPGPRKRHELVWDPGRQQLVLIGGVGPILGWNGTSWEEITIYCNNGCTNPAIGLAITYHPGWGRLVGYFNSGSTHSIEGNQWQNPVNNGQTPGARTFTSLTHDPVRNVLWLFGGKTPDDGFPNDVWRLDDQGWHQHRMEGLPGPTTPWGRWRGVTIWHPQLAQTLVFGGWGTDYGAGMLANPLALSTWLWDGTTWSERSEWFRSDTARFGQAAAYDASRDELVQFGGLTAGWVPTSSTFIFAAQ